MANEPEEKPSQEEAAADFDPDDVREYLEGVEYPASKEDLISTAENNGAPEDLLEMIGTLDRPEFSSEEDVIEELQAAPGAG